MHSKFDQVLSTFWNILSILAHPCSPVQLEGTVSTISCYVHIRRAGAVPSHCTRRAGHPRSTAICKPDVNSYMPWTSHKSEIKTCDQTLLFWASWRLNMSEWTPDIMMNHLRVQSLKAVCERRLHLLQTNWSQQGILRRSTPGKWLKNN